MKTKFLADKNIPLEVVLQLKKDDLDILSVSNTNPGIVDEEVLTVANKEKRVLITFDNDFGELIFKQKRKSSGVIILQIIPQTPDYILSILKRVLAKDINFSRSFSIVEIDRVRVIPLIQED